MELVKPKRLQKGDNILIVTPSSNITTSDEIVQRGVKNLEGIGFNVEIHPSCWDDCKGTAGTPVKRAKVLMDAFKDDSVDGIMCYWGGWNSNDILDHLEWDVIRANPKVFIGYSDITVLNTVFYEKAGLVNFQGPALITFTHDFLMPWEVQVFKDVLMNPTKTYTLKASPSYVDDAYFYMHPETPVEEKPNPGWRIIKEGTSQGRLIGGHIGTLLALAGTEYWPDLEGKLLFLEEDEEGNTKNLRRLMRQLEQIGVLDEINGLLIGRIPEASGIKGDLWFGSLVEDTLEGLNYPVVAEMDFGHTNPIATIPVGIKAEISTQKKTLTFQEPCVR
ncbi:MAG: S66 peptidase family protein [Candidatus Bathyarchaeota archaeon]